MGELRHRPPTFASQMRVLLTGATGFLGSYILRELIAQGHDVRCILQRPVQATLDVQSPKIERVRVTLPMPTPSSGPRMRVTR
jgi:NAD(P)-dependent dehydrogenase (short-subunit alcohol dehydrogenase family)